ncbi:MAG: quinone-dependent dihydroorotate dehydrogenase [Alphaproteobacteria bacterium]|nr:quinone-dependent dihydroorotate dehydrogenase [Alphaproteobacteria bacterium]
MIDPFRLARPLLHAIDPERAHGLAIRALALGLTPAPRLPDDPPLRQRLMGLDFANPIGLAAGFDKNAEVPDRALALGFGFVEVGTITPRPQAGNPRPRLFRLAEDEAVINRMGFNGDGLAVAQARLAARTRRGLVGANVGANKDSADPAADYATGAAALAPHADYLVCNVSSPNTPGLRDLQGARRLEALLARVMGALPAEARPPVLVKIAPDLAEGDLADIVAVACDGGAAGIIVGNTTIARPAGLRSRFAAEKGGLSGRPLFAPSTAILRSVARLAAGRLVLIGCGGISSGADAYAKIRAGAALVQIYSALVYHGPALVARIRRELARLLERDGFSDIRAAIGADLPT